MSVTGLVRLRAEHEEALLRFERENRAYFAASVSDRGEEYFERFDEGFHSLLAEQAAGTCAFFVLVEGEEILGRFNLYDLTGGTATVGYRVAESAAGQGVATAAVGDLCAQAAGLGLHTLTAAAADANVASRRVLVKAGFTPVGAADPSEVGGRSGTRYRRALDGVD